MEKRFGFIRSENPFKGLDDYLLADELRISNSQIEYPIQLVMDGFGSHSPNQGLEVKLGYYFERLTQGIYGGRLKGCHQLINGSKIDYNIITSEPDVVSDEKNYSRESKAVSPGAELKIEDEQMAKYACSQLKDYLSAPPRITFEIFRHGVRQLINNFRERPLGDLVDALSSRTRFMISLPLSIVVAIHEANCNRYSSRYEGDKWKHYSKLLSSGLNAMLAYPEETLSEFGLDSDNYNIWKIRFPKGIRVNEKEIKPFPVLLMRDKDHNSWVEDFREKGKELYPTLFRLKSKIEYTPEEKQEITMFLEENLPSGGFGKI